MNSTSRIVGFLIAALILRMPVMAYAVPSEPGGEVHHVAELKSAHCHENQEPSLHTYTGEHGSTSCHIACALAAAPGFIQSPWEFPVRFDPVKISFIIPRRGEDVSPPDTPPPIL